MPGVDLSGRPFRRPGWGRGFKELRIGGLEELAKEGSELLLQRGAALLRWGTETKPHCKDFLGPGAKGPRPLSLQVESLRAARKAGTDTGLQHKGATNSDNL